MAADPKTSGPDEVAPKAKAKTTTIDTVDILILKNEFTQIPDTVFKHELPILRFLHGGPDAVQVRGEDSIEVADFNANDELARLQRKYNSKEVDAVGAVYQNDPRNVAKEAGVSFSEGQAKKPARSSQSAPKKKKVIGAKK